MISLNDFLKSKGFKEKIATINGKETHCLKLVIAEKEIIYIYTPNRSIPLDFSDTVFLHTMNMMDDEFKETMTFYSALKRVFPRYEDFNVRMFIGNPIFLTVFDTKINDTLTISDFGLEQRGDDGLVLFINDSQLIGHYEINLNMANPFYVIVENRDASFKTAEEAEAWLFTEWIMYTYDTGTLKYSPLMRKYLCIWGQGYEYKTPEEASLEDLRETGLTVEEIETVKELHQGEAVTFYDKKFNRYMSVVRIL